MKTLQIIDSLELEKLFENEMRTNKNIMEVFEHDDCYPLFYNLNVKIIQESNNHSHKFIIEIRETEMWESMIDELKFRIYCNEIQILDKTYLLNEFIKGCEKIKLDNKRKELADRIKNIDKIMTNEDLDKILNAENSGFGYIFDTNEIIILKSNTGT